MVQILPVLTWGHGGEQVVQGLLAGLWLQARGAEDVGGRVGLDADALRRGGARAAALVALKPPAAGASKGRQMTTVPGLAALRGSDTRGRRAPRAPSCQPPVPDATAHKLPDTAGQPARCNRFCAPGSATLLRGQTPPRPPSSKSIAPPRFTSPFIPAKVDGLALLADPVCWALAQPAAALWPPRHVKREAQTVLAIVCLVAPAGVWARLK